MNKTRLVEIKLLARVPYEFYFPAFLGIVEGNINGFKIKNHSCKTYRVGKIKRLLNQDVL